VAKSPLFRLASRAARFAARRAFQRMPIGRSITQSRRQLKAGAMAPLRRAMNKASRDLTGRTALNRVRRELNRTSMSGMAMQAVNALLRSMGPFGQAIQSSIRSRGGPAKQLQAAADLLRSYGYEILGKDPNWAGYQRGEEAAKEVLENAGYTITPGGRVMPANPPRWMPFPEEEEQPEATTETATAPGRPSDTQRPDLSEEARRPAPQPEGDEDEESEVTVTPEIRTPASSNVYSFQYDYSRSILYVRYQEHTINPRAAKMSSSGGRTHVKGELGRTVGGKTGGPGALYAYYDVPPRIFERIVRAPSAGKAVWDDLRIRGTAYGHRFRYTLAAGQVVSMDGQKGVYIPRKVTPQGFRSRTLAIEGTGRRIYGHSALPEERRNFRGRPNRGTPNRGRP
jgi:hypothetical protein